MTEYIFGSGTVVCKRTDVANQPPAFLGTLQGINVDFDRTLKELMGQYQTAVAIAGSALKISGKATFARIQATTFNNLFWGGTITSNSGLIMTTGEAATIATGSATVSNGSTFQEDFGVFFTQSGQQLSPVASAPAAGQYVPPTASPGTYTFNVGDNGKAITIFYSYTTTGQQQIPLANQLAGNQPSFEMFLNEQFTYFGSLKQLNLKLNAVVSSKITFPFRNQDFTIQDLDFTAYADASNNIGTLSLTE